MKQILLISAIGALIVVGLWFALNNNIQKDVVENKFAHIEVDPLFVDFGDIDQEAGIVSAEVKVKNSGSAALEIYRVSTSCGCTTAEMDTSPILPGQERVLKISFDPMVHPDQKGPITRVVYVQTSDPEQSEFEIDVIGNVIPFK